MWRHLIPRAEWGRWTGDALTINPQGGAELPPGLARSVRIARGFPTTVPLNDRVVGGILTIQWLGFIVEIAIGRVH